MSGGRKKQFILRLAEYLVENQAGKGIALSIESASAPIKWASEWSRVRSASPVRSGYPTIEEAVKDLTDFLG